MKNYSFQIESSKSPEEIFELLLDVKKWWSGLFDETIVGQSKEVNDEFSFSAGGGIHFSRQRLTELIPFERIAWEVTESNLSFLENPTEWKGSRLLFEIKQGVKNTTVLFTHEGLIPEISCYNQCSDAWTQYFQNLQKQLT